jgi:hypothetical protein
VGESKKIRKPKTAGNAKQGPEQSKIKGQGFLEVAQGMLSAIAKINQQI